MPCFFIPPNRIHFIHPEFWYLTSINVPLLMKFPLFGFLLFTIFSLYSCKEKEEGVQASINSIIELQEKSKISIQDSSYVFLKEAEQLFSTQVSIPDSLRAENEYLIGLYFENEEQLDSAAVHYFKATQWVQDSIKSPREVLYFRKAWGLYLLLEDHTNGLSISNRFISLLVPNDFENLALAYDFSENVYMSLQNYSMALEFSEKGAKAYSEKGDISNLTRKKIDQAFLQYFNLGNSKDAFKILDSLAEKSDGFSENLRAQLYDKYGILRFYAKDYSQSRENYQKALEEIKRIPSLESGQRNQRLGSQYANIMEVCIELKEYDLARKYADSVFLLGIDNVQPSTYQNVLKYQLKLDYETQNDIGSLLSSIDKLRTHQNKVHEEKMEAELLALTEANKRERDLLISQQELEINNLTLKQNRNWLIISICFLFLLIAIGVLFYRQRTIKSEREQLLMQQRLLRSQMNPHFTLNALSAIQRLIRENQEKSVDYLVKFSRLLGLIFENSQDNYIPLKDELESIENYLQLQSLRFPSRFTFQMHRKNGRMDVLVPPMLIQPFVENCIQHGFSDPNIKGKIDLSVVILDDFVFCEIEDNGIGSLPPNPDQSTRSTALIAKFLKKTTGKEIEYINKSEKSENDRGLIVRLHLPYKN
ncbi:histidine kinase [Aureisphaera galaxeae]|uniref:histidine kinase n=1 Tax=Aureisphaera galaxeae TaxID=1538023 RepID=UPI002350B65D|nr:histidine kinase [Aureisphaera galaxeae]MDC8005400.1 histidine kinase [Aureisphaera galaxeae]